MTTRTSVAASEVGGADQAPGRAKRRRRRDPTVSARSRRPRFRELTPAEIARILERNHIGRVAFASRHAVDIQPLAYVYEQGWIYGRTSPGAKLVALAHRRWVAFEVDEIEGPFDWRSVVVQGAFYVLTPDAPPREARAWERAVELLRSLTPAAMTERDPTPFRTVMFRIAVDGATGRASSWQVPDGEPG